MQQAAAYIDAHADESLPLTRLAREAAMSPHHFQRTFTAVLGVSPKQYQSARRLAQFKEKLREGDTVLSATFDAGYGSTSRVYEQVTGGLGMTPSAYRAGGAGETIVYTVRETAFGALLMAATGWWRVSTMSFRERVWCRRESRRASRSMRGWTRSTRTWCRGRRVRMCHSIFAAPRFRSRCGAFC
jgi:AraC-like DNA-binding protein